MRVIPKTYHIVVRPDAVEEISKGGIYLPKDKLAEVSAVTGVVTAIGPECWPDHKFSEPAAKIGDRVLYQRGSGMRVPDGKDGFLKDVLILNDLDVVAVLEEGDR